MMCFTTMQPFKLWRPPGTSLSAPAVISRVVKSGFTVARRSNWSLWKLERGWKMFGLSSSESIGLSYPIRVHVRSLGLLRREAQAGLKEKEQKNCILLSPEYKIPERSGNYDSLFPCPQEKRPPRIEHLLCVEDGNVVEIVSKALSLPTSYVEDLIHIGAVYYALVCPPPPKVSLTTAQMEVYRKASVLSQNKKRPSLKGKTIVEAQKTFRVTSIYEGIEAGSYLRVHVHVKRFPRCYEVDWKSGVIAEMESYVVLDKPAGVPVGGSVDNSFECCAVFTAHALGLCAPLRLTHQIDNCTEGCVVLSKTKEFSSEFHLLLRKKEIQKHYLVLAAAPVPTGRVSHYMRPGHRHPRIVSSAPHAGWAACQLEILDCKEVSWPTPEVEAKYRVQDFGWEPRRLAYECRVQIVTGRTHQVRAQFAALRAPIIGDSMYMPAVVSCIRSPDVYPFPSKSPDSNDDDNESVLDVDEAALERWISVHGTEPEYAIGLQASQISWDDGACLFKAGEPWWRL